jgi:hypothetical protein
MRYFIDTEFIEYPNTIDLISVGIVAEDGRELYLINQECAFEKANDWVKENVIPHIYDINTTFGGWDLRSTIAKHVINFVGSGKPEFWGYYADYDWVVFCWLFGSMIDLPKGWPMYCRDIKQLCDDLGNPQLPEQGKGEHHALADARWNKRAFEFLQGLK